jgi:hypothetical protein
MNAAQFRVDNSSVIWKLSWLFLRFEGDELRAEKVRWTPQVRLRSSSSRPDAHGGTGWQVNDTIRLGRCRPVAADP